MKDNSNIMKRMLWKDAKTIWPLLQSILIGMVAFNLIGLLGSTFMPQRNAFYFYLASWILMPNLLALGAPALLVGSEEESGTLAWLRTLPVKWQQIVDSKFLVSAIALLIGWIVSTVIVCAVCFGPGGVNENTRAVWDQGDLLSLAGFGQLFFMSFILLTTGFITAYLFRAPIAALIALVPIMFAIYPLTFFFGDWILSGRWNSQMSLANHVSPSRWALVFTAALAWLALLWAIQRLLGRRRLTSAGRRRKPVSQMKKLPKFAYRPPTGVGMQPPTPSGALLWQQMRQVGPAVAVMAGASTLFLFLAMSRTRGGLLEDMKVFAPLIVGTSSMWIGSIVFYGDSVRRRCAYFADRGISPTQVWWTRLLIPGLACLLITTLAFFADLTPDFHSPGFPWYIVPILFGFGQLVSQWVSRPILSFFAAPVYVGVCCLYYFAFFDKYNGYTWTTCLLLPVLLFATWRLTRRWLDGRIDNGFHWRAIAYTALAISIPLCVTVAHRIASTPRLDVAWRQKAMAATDQMQWQGSYLSSFSPYHNPWKKSVSQSQVLRGFDELLKDIQDELNHPGGGFTSAYELRAILEPGFGHNNEPAKLAILRAKSVEAMLKTAAVMRQEAVDGKIGLQKLQRLVEPMEREAVEFLRSQAPTLNSRKQVVQLVNMIPSKELRYQSRKTALLRDWRRYQETTDYDPVFLGLSYPRGMGLNDLEKRRSDRFIDKVVKELWQDLETGLPDVFYVTDNRGRRFANVEGRQSPYYFYQANDLVDDARMIDYQFDTWTAEYEKNINALRMRYPAPTENANAEKLEASTD